MTQLSSTLHAVPSTSQDKPLIKCADCGLSSPEGDLHADQCPALGLLYGSYEKSQEPQQ